MAMNTSPSLVLKSIPVPLGIHDAIKPMSDKLLQQLHKEPACARLDLVAPTSFCNSLCNLWLMHVS
jgi:hypothetical protein